MQRGCTSASDRGVVGNRHGAGRCLSPSVSTLRIDQPGHFLAALQSHDLARNLRNTVFAHGVGR
ncbi:hypothetical protein SDC9_126450 [bioreactor metagenome]|uniref:Uncharacterized protein n=1 Tax=bioreactor metagenome TaxID=1076179 RepID=A0A645CR78_9ZZZZ